MAIQRCMETEWNVQELILVSGDRGQVFARECIRKRKKWIFCSRVSSQLLLLFAYI